MGLIDRIFGRRKPAGLTHGSVQTFEAYAPQFTSWNGQIYESMLVRQAIYAKDRHIMKLKFDMRGAAKKSLRSTLSIEPNPWHTWPDFLEQCNNIYEVENNLIVVPVLDDLGDMQGLWPVYPSGAEVREANGQFYVVFLGQDGKRHAMELERCGIMRKHQLKNNFFGESNAPLAPTMSLAHTFNESIEESVKSAASYKFMAQVTNYMFDEDLTKERKRFDKLNFQPGQGGGLLLFNNNVKDIKQLEAAKNLVDKDQQDLIEKNVYAYFGVNEKVIMNTATPDVPQTHVPRQGVRTAEFLRRGGRAVQHQVQRHDHENALLQARDYSREQGSTGSEQTAVHERAEQGQHEPAAGRPRGAAD